MAGLFWVKLPFFLLDDDEFRWKSLATTAVDSLIRWLSIRCVYCHSCHILSYHAKVQLRLQCPRTRGSKGSIFDSSGSWSLKLLNIRFLLPWEWTANLKALFHPIKRWQSTSRNSLVLSTWIRFAWNRNIILLQSLSRKIPSTSKTQIFSSTW